MSKFVNPTKVITGPNTRWSYANVWEAKSINGSTPKFSVSLIIPKTDTATIEKINRAIKAAYEEGQSKLRCNSKFVPDLESLKLPLRDGDKERKGDPAYAGCMFINANSSTAPGMSIQKVLAKFPVPDSVWEEYHLSEQINDRGIGLDRQMVEQAIQLDAQSRDELSAEMQKLTQLENPNSVAQMKQWLADHGVEVDSLDKKAVKELLKTAPPELAQALELRQQLARSSVKKYIAMENCVCADGRCRGMFQFYGANRSGRWAGRLIQLQNLPQNHIPDLASARSLVKAGDYEMLRLLYEDVPDTLSQLIRTAFVPKPGYKFIVSDFSAIEARVIAHLAGEAWRTEVFRNNGDIYCASASAMFGVPVEKHGVNGHLRQKGKIAELALGYGGSVGALKAMGALDMGLKEEELQPLVSAWRQSNPNIVAFWWDVDDAVKTAIRRRTATETHGIQRQKLVVCDRRMAVVVRSKSLRMTGTPRRRDSISLRPPPLAQESTKVHFPF